MAHAQLLILDAGYSMLDSGFWILDAGFSMLDSGFSILDAGFSMVDTRFSCGKSGFGLPKGSAIWFDPEESGLSLRFSIDYLLPMDSQRGWVCAALRY